MSYEFVKVKGRVQFYKNGQFDHQQFKGHWGFRDPAGYIANCEALDAEAAEYEAEREAAEYEAEREAAREAAAAEYIAKRAARAVHLQMELFA